MKRWILLVLGFLLVAAAAILASAGLALLPLNASQRGDGSPGDAMAFFAYATLYAILIVPAGLCWFAHFSERQLCSPRPKWTRLLVRLPFGIIAFLGLAGAWWTGFLIRHDAEPHWQLKVLVSCVVALVAGHPALRIRGLTRPKAAAAEPGASALIS